MHRSEAPKTPERHGFDASSRNRSREKWRQPLGIERSLVVQSFRFLGAVSAIVARVRLRRLTTRTPSASPAGTVINNTAEVDLHRRHGARPRRSNTVSVTVAEILDVVVTPQTPTRRRERRATTQQVLRYRVTNTGNGPETFRLVMNSVIGRRPLRSGRRHAGYLPRHATRPATCRAGDTPYVAGTQRPGAQRRRLRHRARGQRHPGARSSTATSASRA